MSRLSNLLHDNVIRATTEIRSRLGDANVGSFDFTIHASGRTMTDADECKIEYNVGVSRYDGASVKGNDLERCIVELLRRHGWDETNAPKALPAPRKASGVRLANEAFDTQPGIIKIEE